MPESTDTEKEELRNLVKKMSKYFFTDSKSTSACSGLEDLKDDLDEEYENIINSYLHNMRAMASTASIPFNLAYAATCDKRYQKIHTIEALQSLKSYPDNEGETEEERKARAETNANNQFDKFIKSTEGVNSVVSDASVFLLNSITHGDLHDASSELLNQAAVLLWGALEVFCRDVFTNYLNKNPDSIKLLMKDVNARRRFEGAKITIDELSNYGFNLSAQMGEYLASQQDMSDLKTIKAIYLALFPNDEHLQLSLNCQNIWVLGQRRHLLVHRCGIIDKKYIDSTGDDLGLGDKLRITPDELESYIEIVCNIAQSIINCIAAK